MDKSTQTKTGEGNALRVRCTKASIPYVEALAKERDQLRAKFNSVATQRDDEMKANRKYRSRITKLKAQRDELLAALKEIAHLPASATRYDGHKGAAKLQEMALAAIANYEGRAQ